MLVAFDFGISNTDIAFFQDNKTTFHSIPSEHTSINPELIKENLILQLTAPVKWTQIMNNMMRDGLTEVVEVGPGKVLQGLFKKIDRELTVSSAIV